VELPDVGEGVGEEPLRHLGAPDDGLRVVDRGVRLAGDLVAGEIADDAGVGGGEARGTAGGDAVVAGDGLRLRLGRRPAAAVVGLDLDGLHAGEPDDDVAAADRGLDAHRVLGGVLEAQVDGTLVHGGLPASRVTGDV